MSVLERTFRPRQGKHADAGHELGVISGMSALSLDALSSVAYGPETMIQQLLAGGVAALVWTLPIALVITAMLVLLTISYRQVIAAHPDGGGAYAVSKTQIGRWAALLAAASLVVDYTLTVAVSLAAGAAALASAFSGLASHELLICLIGLVGLTGLNWVGISESAKALFPFLVLFVGMSVAIIIVGPFHAHPVAVVGTVDHVPVTDALGVVLILKAFAAGCSAVTGVEAIANGVPAFKEPKVKTAQRTMICLGITLAVMLVGLVALVRFHHVTQRSGVTILAQLAADAFGKGGFYYAYNIITAAVLGLAANTSFGGLPVLMSLLARDHRLPHMFYLRAEKPVYRHGIAALAIFAAILLLVSKANVNALIPMYAIGVFIGFTLSQLGLVRGWIARKPAKWRRKLALNGTGMVMTGCAAIIFLLSKFTEGAWVLVIAIPALIYFFHAVERYYSAVGKELRLGFTPPRPVRHESIVIVPATTVNLLTQRALSAALSMGDTVVAVAVAGDERERDEFVDAWDDWESGVSLEVVIDKQRSLIRSVYRYVRDVETDCESQQNITVLIPEVLPRKRRHEILHNQRGRLLASVLRARTDVVIATIGLHLHD